MKKVILDYLYMMKKNNKYSSYHEIGVNKITIYPLETSEEIKRIY